MLITDIPTIEPLRRTTLTEKTQQMKKAPYISYDMPPTCYILSGPEFHTQLRDDYTLASGGSETDDLISQASLIILANEFLKESTPVSGEIMVVLNKTFARLRSTVPTKF